VRTLTACAYEGVWYNSAFTRLLSTQYTFRNLICKLRRTLK